MTALTELERITYLQGAIKDAVKYNGDFMEMNEDLLSEYLGEPYGDEIEGQSQVVSTDIADVVEADMPSLARIFLGTNDILEFQANTDDPMEVREAEEKTKYINYLVRNRPESFKTVHDWLKDAEIQKFGAVKFYVEEKKAIELKTYKGLSVDEITQLKLSLKEGRGVESVKIESQDEDDGLYNIVFKVTQKQQKIIIQGVPTEDFLITRNARSISSATLVGDITSTTRKALIAEGYPKDKVAKIPACAEDVEGNRMKQIRFEGQGGYDNETHQQIKMDEQVLIANVYPLVDFDGDGVVERRNVIMSADGSVILQDEPYGIAPYAMLSAVLMPHSAIGRSRAEITAPTQYVKTHIVRQTLNNMYQVNKPRFAVDDSKQSGVDLDDLLTQRLDGIIRVTGNPYEKIMPVVTPYVGDKALQVLQYIDFARAQTTGSLMASQGLSADDLHKETATRFEGVADASEAKVELVARVYAETGFRELYEGLAWLVQHYQDEASEIRVLGKPLTVDPTAWQYEHNCISNVGLGAGDTQEIMANMGGVLSIQQQLAAIQSPLVDSKKIYNTLTKLIKAMGQAKVSDYFNDPERPAQLLLAENEQLKAMLGQMQQQMQNPLAEAERIKAEAKIAVDSNKQRLDLATNAAKIESQMEVEAMKQQGETNRQLMELAIRQDEFMKEMIARLTEMELKYGQNVPGSAV